MENSDKNRPVDNHSPQNSVISGRTEYQKNPDRDILQETFNFIRDAWHQNRRGYALKLGPCLGKLWGPEGGVKWEKGAPARHDSDSETL